MSEPRTCPRCGASLAGGDELCPRCLIELGRATSEPEGEVARGSTRRASKRPAPPLAEIAARFPELEVVALIGEGGMGAVYKARQPKIERWVALKVLALDSSDDPTFAERFRREALVLARLDHKNVVRLFDFGERDGLFYLVLEFVDGTNLRALMKQSLLAPRDALAIVPQMCEALQFAHDEGIVHRDIKPENVLIDPKGHVKIADFGLAKLVDADARDVSLTEVGQVMGTPHYMAPEQLRGAHDVDHRADIYSLGVVFYEMLTGELPRGNFELPSRRVQVDVKLDDIVLKSLERTPERRYQHAVDIKTDVEGVGAADDAERRAEGLLRGTFVGIAIRGSRRWLNANRARQSAGDRRRKHRVIVYPCRPWQFFFMCVVVWWPLAGWAFNEGIWFLSSALVFLGASFWSMLEAEVRHDPELEVALAAEPKSVRSTRGIAALFLLTFGMIALFVGGVSTFEYVTATYRSGPSDAEAMRDLTTRLLPILQTRMQLAWPAELQNVQFTLTNLWSLDRTRWMSQPWLVAVAGPLCAAAGLALTAPRARLARWSGWLPSLRAIGVLFGSLFLVVAVCAINSMIKVQGGPLVPVLDPRGVGASTTSPRSSSEIEDALRKALVADGYDVTATGIWWVSLPGVNAEEQWMHVWFADSSSVFDRWRMTWRGPKRTMPHAVFVLRGSKTNPKAPAQIACDLGDLLPDSPERKTWTAWSGQILAGLQ
jgi:tRNA A-37 threonylcarbamoyl transferase component Bud32